MDRGAWWATARGVTESWTRLKGHSMHTQALQAGLRVEGPLTRDPVSATLILGAGHLCSSRWVPEASRNQDLSQLCQPAKLWALNH